MKKLSKNEQLHNTFKTLFSKLPLDLEKFAAFHEIIKPRMNKKFYGDQYEYCLLLAIAHAVSYLSQEGVGQISGASTGEMSKSFHPMDSLDTTPYGAELTKINRSLVGLCMGIV